MSEGWDEMGKVYNDVSAWIYFNGADEYETVGVYRRCIHCARYVTKGELFMNAFGNIKLRGWNCKVHGEIQPYFDRNIQEYSNNQP